VEKVTYLQEVLDLGGLLTQEQHENKRLEIVAERVPMGRSKATYSPVLLQARLPSMHSRSRLQGSSEPSRVSWVWVHK
jgi:hypothetical protein